MYRHQQLIARALLSNCWQSRYVFSESFDCPPKIQLLPMHWWRQERSRPSAATLPSALRLVQNVSAMNIHTEWHQARSSSKVGEPRCRMHSRSRAKGCGHASWPEPWTAGWGREASHWAGYWTSRRLASSSDARKPACAGPWRRCGWGWSLVTGEYVPNRGDAVWLEFDPQAGHEQAGRFSASGPTVFFILAPAPWRAHSFARYVLNSRVFTRTEFSMSTRKCRACGQ